MRMRGGLDLVVLLLASALMGAGGASGAGKIAAADAAARGEVSVVGISHSFPDGRIDWLFNPTAKKGPFNPEWTEEQFRIMENQPKLRFIRVEHLADTDRGGFGSTGK